MSEKSESDLVEAARLGDREAMERLVETISPRLLRFSLRLCGRPEDAEDVLQESLLAAARGLRSFRGEAALSTWLFSIARSFCIKKRRRKRSIVAVSLDSDATTERQGAVSPERSPLEALEGARLRAAMDRALAHLDASLRDVLVLRDVEGLSAAETASAMGLSVAAVKSRLHRARAAVRQRLAPLLAPSTMAPAAGCPDIVRLFSRHLEGEIAPRACAEMEHHLSGCPTCKAACDSLRATLELCRNTPLPAVPRKLQERIRGQIRALAEPILVAEDPTHREGRTKND